MRTSIPGMLHELAIAAQDELDHINSRAASAEEEIKCLHRDIELLTTKLTSLEEEQAKLIKLKRTLAAVFSEDSL